MSTKIDTKQVRKINKFLREKVGFQKINGHAAIGEFRITKIKHPQNKKWDVEIDLEFKGEINQFRYSNPKYRTKDFFKYYSTIRLNSFLREKLIKEVKLFTSMFVLIKRAERPKIGKVTWIE